MLSCCERARALRKSSRLPVGVSLEPIPKRSGDGLAAPSGDIPQAQTHVAAARTLGAALGIPEGVLADDFVADAGGKIVRTALAI
jgi:hypothetical protein